MQPIFLHFRNAVEELHQVLEKWKMNQFRDVDKDKHIFL